MNHTHIALLALLLPISGYAITKEERAERMRFIEFKIEELTEKQTIVLMNLYAGHLAGIELSPEETTAWIKSCDTYESQINKLEKEYKELEEGQE
jgi:hypothetical protein